MGVEEIVRLIEREAADESARLVADATVEAASLVEEAEAAARARVAGACELAEPAIRAEATRRVNAARRRLLERRAGTTAGLIDAVMVEAGAKLDEISSAIDRPRWEAALSRLTVAALDMVGSGAVVRVRAADAPLVAEIIATAGGRLEPLPDPSAPPGVQASSADGRLEVDATLAARLTRARTILAEDLGRALGLEGGPMR